MDSIRRIIRVCGHFGHCHISQNLFNKIYEVGYVIEVSLHLFSKPFTQITLNSNISLKLSEEACDWNEKSFAFLFFFGEERFV
jgi:hypothetical protein